MCRSKLPGEDACEGPGATGCPPPAGLVRWRAMAPTLQYVLAAAAAALICMGAGEVKSDSAVVWPTHGWQKGTPADVGLDENILTGLDADLRAGKEGIVDSFQVFRCG